MQTQFQFQLFSDIHLELSQKKIFCPMVKAEYLILAGDIGNVKCSNYKLFFEYCSKNWKKVYYVLGNHEYYSKHSMTTVHEQITLLLAEYPNVILLSNAMNYIDEQTLIYGFIGWTYPIFKHTHIALEYLNDYNYIKTTEGRFTIKHHNDLAIDGITKFKQFIENANNNDTIKNIIVVTHFPPINMEGCITSNPEYGGKNDYLKNYYSWTNLMTSEQIVCDKIKLWCSGHTHWKYDFIHQTIRFVSNPIGYEEENFELNDESYFMII